MIQYIYSLHGLILRLLAFSALCLGGYANALDSKKLESTLEAQGFSAPKVVLTKDTGLQDFTFVMIKQKWFLPLLVSNNGKIAFLIQERSTFSADEKFQSKLEDFLQIVRLHNREAIDRGVIEVFRKLEKHGAVTTIPNKTAKHTTFMVLDPNCPYCIDEVKKIEQYTNDTLKIMVIDIIKPSPTSKAAAFLKLIQNAKTKNEQIAVLKRVFDESFDPNSVSFASSKEQEYITNTLKTMGTELHYAGLGGVPYIIRHDIK